MKLIARGLLCIPIIFSCIITPLNMLGFAAIIVGIPAVLFGFGWLFEKAFGKYW